MQSFRGTWEAFIAAAPSYISVARLLDVIECVAGTPIESAVHSVEYTENHHDSGSATYDRFRVWLHDGFPANIFALSPLFYESISAADGATGFTYFYDSRFEAPERSGRGVCAACALNRNTCPSQMPSGAVIVNCTHRVDTASKQPCDPPLPQHSGSGYLSEGPTTSPSGQTSNDAPGAWMDTRRAAFRDSDAHGRMDAGSAVSPSIYTQAKQAAKRRAEYEANYVQLGANSYRCPICGETACMHPGAGGEPPE